ncbi:MAG: hypothetical protein L7H18_04145 [Candidatus Nealsonbacteria bacterium DGGOD1a]|jgi:Sigma-70, region 4./HNH endonuclease.|nr:MAG: hypothetical protein L7H18_04145 [Candidatus Nealsonbacteria bacterium DGGOD1a]
MEEAEKNITRLLDILELYKQGCTLEEIGQKHGITRERIRQLLSKAIMYEIHQSVNAGQVIDVSSFVDDIKKSHETKRDEKKYGSYENRRNELMQKASTQYSLNKFLSDEKISLKIIKKNFPEIIDILGKNSDKYKQRWSRFYLKCRNCGTTTTPHHSYGLCRNCYFKSDYFKDLVKASNERNAEKIKQKNKEYSKKYAQRPEVKKKMKEAWNLKHFGGNREKAIERDGFKCTRCGLDRGSSQKDHGKDLFVRHIDNDPKNNEINNLKTLCYKCFRKEPKFH